LNVLLVSDCPDSLANAATHPVGNLAIGICLHEVRDFTVLSIFLLGHHQGRGSLRDSIFFALVVR